MRRGPPIVYLFFAVAALVAPAIGALTASTPVLAQAPVREAPLGDKASSLAVNYTRLKPHIATAGLLRNGAAPALKALGFATIVDLRGPDEGTAAEKAGS